MRDMSIEDLSDLIKDAKSVLLVKQKLSLKINDVVDLTDGSQGWIVEKLNPKKFQAKHDGKGCTYNIPYAMVSKIN